MITVTLLWIALISVILVSGYFIRNLMVQSETYQEISMAAHEENQMLWKFLMSIRQEVKDVHMEMKQIDNRGIFEKDDHVGFIFTRLLKMSDRLYHFVIDRIDIEEDADSEET